MQYATAGEARPVRAAGSLLDQDDTEGWLQRQQALQHRWRAEDAAAAKEIHAVAYAAASLSEPLCQSL